MLKKLYLIQTCLIIIQCSNGKPCETVELISTPISIRDRVNQEVSPFQEILVKFRTASGDKAERLMGEIIGSLREIIKRAIMADQLLEEKGEQKNQMNNIRLKALRTFAIPYLCRNLELYESVWDCGGQNSLNFDPDNVENTEAKCHDLDTQTSSNYKSHAKIWDRILQSSTHPLAKCFKTKIQLLYPELSLQIIAKNIGLAYALLNNAKHGAINDDPDLKALINPDELILVLKQWDVLKDPVVLNIIKTFEQVVSGL